MELFYSSGASSLAIHILLNYLGIPYTKHQVNLGQKTWSDGSYNTINPKSYVPALITDDGKTLTEVAVILEYLARLTPEKSSLLAPYASPLYWKQRIWLNYIATELHKNFISPLRDGNWLPNTPESQALISQRVTPRLNYVEANLNDWKKAASDFTIVDAYLFVMLTWVNRLKMSLADFPQLNQYYQTLMTDPIILQTLKAEGKPHSLTES